MKPFISLIIIVLISVSAHAQEKDDFEGLYFQLSNQFELMQYYPEEEGNWASDTYQNVGFEIGKYKGAQSYGISISYGFDDQNSDTQFFEGEREYDSFWRLTGVFQNRIIGTKAASKFRLHLGGFLQGGVQRSRGEEGTGRQYNDQTGVFSYPVKSIKRTDLMLSFAPYLEIGGRMKRGGVHLNVQPIGVLFSTHGIGIIAGRAGLTIQL